MTENIILINFPFSFLSPDFEPFRVLDNRRREDLEKDDQMTYFWHMDYLTQQIIATLFPYSHQIISKTEIWVLAHGEIMKTRKTDIASK